MKSSWGGGLLPWTTPGDTLATHESTGHLTASSSLQDIFAVPVKKKDGTDGKKKVLPPLDDLQRSPETFARFSPHTPNARRPTPDTRTSASQMGRVLDPRCVLHLAPPGGTPGQARGHALARPMPRKKRGTTTNSPRVSRLEP